MKVLTVFGTRPEAIKLAPVVKALQEVEQIQSYICVTGQHRQMLDQMLALFAITPDYDLKIMRPGQTLTDITTTILQNLKPVLTKLQPDWIIVQGDTTTAFAAALAAFYQQIAVAHVEAGLRTGDRYSPWPEEMNRKLAGALTTLHFPPTEHAAQNLQQENIAADSIIVTGNTVVDALLEVTTKLRTDQTLANHIASNFPFLDPNKKLILVTGHRRENFGGGFDTICQALAELAQDDNVQIVYPVHLNPRVREPVKRILGQANNIHLIEPLDYVPFAYLMDQAYLILTDSGGIQEEAPSLGKPVLVMRNTTERPEGVMAGTAKLVGTDREKIVCETKTLLNDQQAYLAMSRVHNPYGDGNAASRIVDALLSYGQTSSDKHSTKVLEKIS